MLRRTLAAGLMLFPLSLSTAQVATDTARIDPVVVTATRNPLAIGDIPASVTVLLGADLRARGITAVSDALREVPGIALARTGSFGGQTALFVRGGQSNYTKILIDGVPVNQSGGAYDLATLTTDNVERIEVVRGPSSVVWGSDAVTGVINVITRDGRGGPTTSAGVRAGSYGILDAEVQVGRAVGGGGISLGLAHHGTNGIYAFNNRFAQSVLSGLARGSLGERTSAMTSIRYSDHASHFPTDGSGNAVDSNAYGFAGQLAISAQVRHVVDSRLTLVGIVNASSYDGGTDDAAGQGDTTESRSLEHITRRGAELRAIATLPHSAVLTLGSQIEGQGHRSHSEFDGFPTFFNSARQNVAGFAEVVLTAARSTATVGARLDHNSRFGDFGTFRVGVQHEVARAIRLRGSVGTAFREPSMLESFTTAYTTGNPDLRPERTASWEVGVVSQIRERLSFQATWFDQRFVDLIDYNGGAPVGAPNYENIAKATSRGAEFELSHAPVHGLGGSLAVTHLDTEVEERGFNATSTATLVEGQRLLRRPEWSASGRIGYAGIPRLRADVVATYTGTRDDRRFLDDAPFVEAVVLPAHTLVDLSADYLLRPRMSSRAETALTLRIANIGDVQYEGVAGYRTPGRTILGGLRIAH